MLKWFQGILKMGIKISIAHQKMTKQHELTECYIQQKEHIYALYWGIANKDFGKTGKVCYILKFDWNGNLKEGFKVNNLLKNIAIDEISNCIYAVTYPEDERESILMKYEM